MESLRLSNFSSSVVDEIRKFLAGKSETLVVTHFYPDGDAIGSLLAFGGMLQQLDIPYVLAIDDKCPGKYDFLNGIQQIRNLKEAPLNKEYYRVVILDAGAISRIGSAYNAIGTGTEILNIDHHFTGDIYGKINLVNTEAAATSELLFDLFQALGITVTADMASALFTGILTDTGRFRFANTTGHAMHVAAELISLGADAGVLTENIYYNMSVEQARSIASALGSMELYANGRVCMIGLQGEDRITETEGFVEYAASIKDVMLAVFYCEIDKDLFKVSLRSRCDVDVSAVASGFGGGGHRKASGYRYRGDLVSLKQKLISVLENHLDNRKHTSA